jgi:hypothetical protein
MTLSRPERTAGDGQIALSRQALADVAAVCGTFQITTLLPQLIACSELAESQGVVDIAVLGQFKAGKSSFLNSLIGEEVLPVDVLPATAVVTRLGHGETDEVQLRLISGEIRNCAVTDLAAFVTEHGNPGT